MKIMSLQAHVAIAKHPERKQPSRTGDCFVATTLRLRSVRAPRNDMSGGWKKTLITIRLPHSIIRTGEQQV
jgi:hypothetical protein